MIRIVLTLLLLILASVEARAQSCAAICNQYYAYARNAGAMGTYGPLVNLYNRCMACQRGGVRRQATCPQGKVRHGRYCITQGHKICPGTNRTCPQDQECAPSGCMPKGASACPGGKGFCSAPKICAANLNGEDKCFTRESYERLKKVKHEKKLRDAREKNAEKEKAAHAEFAAKQGKKYDDWIGSKQTETAQFEVDRIREIAERNPRVRKAYQEMLKAEIEAARAEGKAIDEKRRLLLHAEAVVRGADIAVGTAAGAVPLGSQVYSGSQLLTDYALGEKSGATAAGQFAGGAAGGAFAEALGVPAAAPIAKTARTAIYLSGEFYKLEKNKTR